MSTWSERFKTLVEITATQNPNPEIRARAQSTLDNQEGMAALQDRMDNDPQFAADIDKLAEDMGLTGGPKSAKGLIDELGGRCQLPPKPQIEGTHAFDRIWKNGEHLLGWAVDAMVFSDEVAAAGMKDIDNPIPLAGACAAMNDVMHTLAKAHIITVDPDQLRVLPNWGGGETSHTDDNATEEAIEYGQSIKHLPFDTIFFDCELPTRRYAFDAGTGLTFHFKGGLVYLANEILTIIPFLFVGDVDPNDQPEFSLWRGTDFKNEVPVHLGYLPMGEFNLNLRADPQQEVATSQFKNAKPFWEAERDILDSSYNQVDMDLGWLSHQMGVHEPGDTAMEFDLSDYHQPRSAARVSVIPRSDGQRDDRNVMTMAASTVIGAMEVLKILYFLDTPGIVELAEAQVSRQVRRAAERDGRKIAQTIFVRQNTKRYERKDDSEHMEYSHRFEVRGHWKYHPEGTRMADARPDLLRYVPGRGMCRKIWCGPFVKGDPDKPLVLKTRIVREQEEPEA